MTNALVSRVRRHASMAVLNRSRDPALIRPAQSIGHPRGLNQQNRSVVQATLVPAGSSLPIGLTLAGVEGGQTVIAATPESARLSPPMADLESQMPPTPTLSQVIQREQITQQSKQTPQPGVKAPDPGLQELHPETEAQQSREQTPAITSVSSPGDSTISDSDWIRLRRFMEGHQERLAREKEEQEAAGPVQMSPEEEAQQEAKRKAQEEIVRRKELIQGGRRPKAKVVYLSPEDQTVEDKPSEEKATDTPTVSDEPTVDVERASAQTDMAPELDFIPASPVEDSGEQVEPLEASPAAAEREIPAELESQPKNISPLERADLPKEQTIPIPPSPHESSIPKSQIQAQDSDKVGEPSPAEIESRPEIAREPTDSIQLTPSVGEFSSTSAGSITETDADYIEPERESARQPADSAQLTPPAEDTSSIAAEAVSVTDQDYQEVSVASDDAKTTGLSGRLFRAVKSFISGEPDKPPASPSVIDKKPDLELSTAEQFPESLPEIGLPEDVPTDSAVVGVPSDKSPEVTSTDLGDSYEAEGHEPDQEAPTVSDSTGTIQRSPEETASPDTIDVPTVTPESSFESGDHEPDQEAPTVSDSTGTIQRSPEETAASPDTIDVPTVTPEPSYEAGGHEPVQVVQTVIDSKGIVQKSSEQAPSSTGTQPDPGQTLEKRRPVESTQAEQQLLSKERSSIDASTMEKPAAEQMPDTIEALSEGTRLEPEAETATGLRLESDDTIVADLDRSSEPESKPADILAPPEISEAILQRRADATTDDTEETVIQQMPLDHVWPVQKSRGLMPTEQNIKDAASHDPSTSSEVRTQRPVVQRRVVDNDAVSDQVEAVLGDVIPGQVSNSSVELVLPRRPRPASTELDLPAIEQTETDGAEKGDHPEISDYAPDQVKQGGLSDIQKQQGDAAGTIDMVPTEIGPLPADLWQMLGQSPPEIPARQHVEKSLPSQATVQRANETVEKAPTESLAPTPQMTDLARELIRPDIQRVDAGSQASDVSDSGEADEESSEEDEEEDSDADIDQLSRQVYPIIKRMLTLERERSRGRF